MKSNTKLYLCSNLDCISCIMISKSFPADYEDIHCMLCETGVYFLYEAPEYVGCRIEGESEYLHKI